MLVPEWGDDRRSEDAPSLAVLAFANDDSTVLLLVTKPTSCSVFLCCVRLGALPRLLAARPAYFWSRYSSPRLMRAASYSLTAASEVTDGGFETISL